MAAGGAAKKNPTSRRGEKSAAAFRTISEVATELDLPQHVLRFWETKFSHIRPLKRGGGRRYYRPEDLDLLRRIRGLLHDEGYTIKGVQKLLRQNGAKAISAPPADNGAIEAAGPPGGGGLDPGKRRELESVLGELKEIRDLLRKAPG